jgi:hypothetical protein
MKSNRVIILEVGLMCICAMSSGCASTYSNLVSGSELGAREYRPAVFVPPGKETAYESVLGICRQAVTNRQITAAQQAQLETLTGVTRGSLSGLSQGMQMGSIFKSAGLGGGGTISRGAGIGALTGLVDSLGSSFASGAEDTAAKTRDSLLLCLRKMASGIGYTVLE